MATILYDLAIPITTIIIFSPGVQLSIGEGDTQVQPAPLLLKPLTTNFGVLGFFHCRASFRY